MLPEFLQSEVWRWVIGGVGALLLVVVSILGSRFVNRQRKNLWYQTDFYPLVADQVEDEKIQISFDGQPLSNVYISIVGLWYQGTEPIVEDDYRTPPTFDFRDAHILDAKAIGSSPPGLEVPLEIISSSKLVFNPIAMNDGNVVSARVLMTPPNTSPRVTGHIVGVNRIRDYGEHRPLAERLVIPVFVLLTVPIAILFVAMLVAAISGFDPREIPKETFILLWRLGIIMTAISVLLMLSILSWFSRSIDKNPFDVDEDIS